MAAMAKRLNKADRRLIEYARKFRKGIIGDKPSARFCFMVCAPLAGLLSFEGLTDADVTEGEVAPRGEPWEHCWLTLSDGRILDPTADQFRDPDGKPMPAIYLGSKPEWYWLPASPPPR